MENDIYFKLIYSLFIGFVFLVTCFIIFFTIYDYKITKNMSINDSIQTIFKKNDVLININLDKKILKVFRKGQIEHNISLNYSIKDSTVDKYYIRINNDVYKITITRYNKSIHLYESKGLIQKPYPNREGCFIVKHDYKKLKHYKY
jgi:hypothetical protein